MRDGDKLIFKTDRIGLEWVVVRDEPDCGTALLCPIDQFPLVGTTDVMLPPVDEPDAPVQQARFVARGGQMDFTDRRTAATGVVVGSVTPEALTIIRNHLAAFARIKLDERPEVDLDPDYEEWIAEVERERMAIAVV